MQGGSVADLQNGLQLLLDKGGIQSSAADQQVLEEGLRAEHTQISYGNVTAKLVGLFQEQRHLPASSVIDEATTKALKDN